MMKVTSLTEDFFSSFPAFDSTSFGTPKKKAILIVLSCLQCIGGTVFLSENF